MIEKIKQEWKEIVCGSIIFGAVAYFVGGVSVVVGVPFFMLGWLVGIVSEDEE